MKQRVSAMAQGALAAAMYAALTHLQNLLLPGSATWAVQLRAAEALCVLALYSKGAVGGLAVGCFLFNLTFAGALPLDPLVGPLATALATALMYRLRKYPELALWLPPVCNGLLIGWELHITTGMGFWLGALYVALGEALVMQLLGRGLYTVIKKQRLQKEIFGDCAN